MLETANIRYILNNGILLPKLFRTNVKKKLQPSICKVFEITKTIYSNSERSEQFLGTE